jgi:hypothetical protein
MITTKVYCRYNPDVFSKIDITKEDFRYISKTVDPEFIRENYELIQKNLQEVREFVRNGQQFPVTVTVGVKEQLLNLFGKEQSGALLIIAMLKKS